MTFLWIWMFALLPLPLVLRYFSKKETNDKNALNGALNVPFFAKLQRQFGGSVNHKKISLGKVLLLSLAWIFLVTALARPAFVGKEVPLPAKGRDLMLAIDLSGSMAERDLGTGTNRLSVVKQAADNFISQRKGDRLGLILFSDRAYLQAPLTFDLQVVQSLLKEAQVGLTGQKTAIGDAIAVALKRLKDIPQNNKNTGKDSRVLVLLTDGANNAGVMQPLKAAQLAKKLGIKIYTIGVGGNGQVIDTPFGRQRIATSDLDETTLTQIAQLTGGKYFRATDAQGLKNIYKDINKLEPVSGEPIFVRPEIALYYYPATLSLGLLILLMLWQVVPHTILNSRQVNKGE
ncbi:MULTISPECIES: vWA domain-containing protein [Pasteurellaceae]|uniref:VWA domain-containing protein n=1 Tax=Pasteurella atlantica TaxID=2827233 RepID=A0AAW8CKS2_9PAST|nr:VWA domain-containing protein [Pasteurella atlantica]MBR0572633.1 VWA domain-containing protein [Pasteurella atlantica]MDP8038579.1 VWA domain-containing protein [Pasteurella atlantica]MDP8040671.1 VWA domain-containing protein [Pasteurella atlantica]MDP8042806.1 VWA domain-containing protein [Pasteurella atlantica]MDP8044893.1 VWA domain-containing protein [Pasteurella atlantica]